MCHWFLDCVLPCTGVYRLEPESALEQDDQPVASRQRIVCERRIFDIALCMLPINRQWRGLPFVCMSLAGDSPGLLYRIPSLLRLRHFHGTVVPRLWDVVGLGAALA